MFSTLSAQIGALMMAGACLFAVSSGGRPQRSAALTAAAAWLGSAALQNRANLFDPQYAIFALDVVAMVAFAWLAVRWRRGWLIWVAAFQLLTMTTHIAVMLDQRIDVRGYLTAYLIWSYLLLAALTWGGVEGWRDRRRRRG